MYLENSGFRRGLVLKTKYSNEVLEFIRNSTIFLKSKVVLTQHVAGSMLDFGKEDSIKVAYTLRLDKFEWRQLGVFLKITGYEFEYELSVEKIVSVVKVSRSHYEFYENFNNSFYRKTIIRTTIS